MNRSHCAPFERLPCPVVAQLGSHKGCPYIAQLGSHKGCPYIAQLGSHKGCPYSSSSYKRYAVSRIPSASYARRAPAFDLST